MSSWRPSHCDGLAVPSPAQLKGALAVRKVQRRGAASPADGPHTNGVQCTRFGSNFRYPTQPRPRTNRLWKFVSLQSDRADDRGRAIQSENAPDAPSQRTKTASVSKFGLCLMNDDTTKIDAG